VALVLMATLFVFLGIMLFFPGFDPGARSNQYHPVSGEPQPPADPSSPLYLSAAGSLLIVTITAAVILGLREVVSLRRERLHFEQLPAEEQARLHEAADDLQVGFVGAAPVADTAASRRGRTAARAYARDEKRKRRLLGR